MKTLKILALALTTFMVQGAFASAVSITCRVHGGSEMGLSMAPPEFSYKRDDAKGTFKFGFPEGSFIAADNANPDILEDTGSVVRINRYPDATPYGSTTLSEVSYHVDYSECRRLRAAHAVFSFKVIELPVPNGFVRIGSTGSATYRCDCSIR